MSVGLPARHGACVIPGAHTHRGGDPLRQLVRPTRLIAAAALTVALGLGAVPSAQGGPTFDETVRFLEQSTFGPTLDLIAHVQQVGFEAFIDEQFALPAPIFPLLDNLPSSPSQGCKEICQRDNYSMYLLQRGSYAAFITSEHQLRLRMMVALSQIFVVSAVNPSLRQPSRMLPYLSVLSNASFGNFRQLLTEITLNPAMGRFLDTVNNHRERPNENYARELLQLLTIGVNLLNPDGTPVVDASGQPVPAYDQSTITAFARVFTGWVFTAPEKEGVPNYNEPMVPGARNAHDRQPKTLLNGVTLPGDRDAPTDLRDALDNIFAHQNVGPFISRRLIQHMVSSNPSPLYVQRVAAVFRATGGDMKSVIKAILLDIEARTDPATGPPGNPLSGYLREPILWTTSFLRMFGPLLVTDFVLADSFLPGGLVMGQDLYRPPSVFSFYPPDNVVAGDAILGPEFAIYSTSTALARTNFAYQVIYKQMNTNDNRPVGTYIDLTSVASAGNDPVGLVDALNHIFLGGRMSPEMRAVIISSTVALPASNPLARLRNALFLIVTSPQYLVQR